jgi:hypothetical protein
MQIKGNGWEKGKKYAFIFNFYFNCHWNNNETDGIVYPCAATLIAGVEYPKVDPSAATLIAGVEYPKVDPSAATRHLP